MKKISIDELNEMVDSQYSLVTIISKRARQIINGSDPLIDTDTKKPVAVSIEEFYEGKFEPIYDYDKYKKALTENDEKTEEGAQVKDRTGDIEERPDHDMSNNQSND